MQQGALLSIRRVIRHGVRSNEKDEGRKSSVPFRRRSFQNFTILISGVHQRFRHACIICPLQILMTSLYRNSINMGVSKAPEMRGIYFPMERCIVRGATIQRTGLRNGLRHTLHQGASSST